MNKSLYISILVFALGLVGCSEYYHVQKGTDYPKKLQMARVLKGEGDCYRALTLYEELMTFYRFSDKSEDVYYEYAQTHYCLGQYYLAGYYFNRFTENYPTSNRVEECAFMSALCTTHSSPEYNLDPTDTKKAIDELQLFMDRYPNSERLDTCNVIVDELRGKLERKSYEQAKLYYKMEMYNSAVVAMESTLEQYPDTDYQEELLFLRVKSYYLLATNSVADKKQERFEKTIESYRIFADLFSGSNFDKEAKRYAENSTAQLKKMNTNN